MDRRRFLLTSLAGAARRAARREGAAVVKLRGSAYRDGPRAEAHSSVAFVRASRARLRRRPNSAGVSVSPMAEPERLPGLPRSWFAEGRRDRAVTAQRLVEAKQATAGDPDRHAAVGDPVERGLIASSRGPAANITGVATFSREMAASASAAQGGRAQRLALRDPLACRRTNVFVVATCERARGRGSSA